MPGERRRDTWSAPVRTQTRELVDLARGQGDPSEIAARREKLENTKMIMEISLLAH